MLFAARMILSELPEDLLTKICSKLDWFGQDCMLIASKPTRAAVQSIVRAAAQKNVALKKSMHMLADLISTRVPSAGDVERWCEDTCYTSTLCVRKRDGGSESVALVDLDRNGMMATACFVSAEISDDSAVTLYITDAPEAGFTRILGRKAQIRPFKSLSEAREHVEEAWAAMALL